MIKTLLLRKLALLTAGAALATGIAAGCAPPATETAPSAGDQTTPAPTLAEPLLGLSPKVTGTSAGGDGSLDNTFAPSAGASSPFSPSVYVFAVAIQDGGKALIGGAFTSVGGQDRNGIARLNSDGSLDTTFDPGAGAIANAWFSPQFGGSTVNAVVVQDDGKVLIGGHFTSVDGQDRNGIARLNSDGSLDTTFGAAIGAGAHNEAEENGTVRAIAVQSDGKVLIVGDFLRVDRESRDRIARLLSSPAGR